MIVPLWTNPCNVKWIGPQRLQDQYPLSMNTLSAMTPTPPVMIPDITQLLHESPGKYVIDIAPVIFPFSGCA
jgi:hypothetical protein